MTSATERLRALVDERGVEHRYDSGTATWYVDGVMYNAWAYDNERLTMSVCHLTPAQAVEATLGRGTCRIDVFDNLNESEGNGDVWLECSACHWQMDYAEAPTMPLNYCPNCGKRVVE